MKERRAANAWTRESFYRVHGVSVRVFCDHEQVHERIREHLAAYLGDKEEEGEAPGVEVELFYGSRFYPVPLHAKRVLRYSRLRKYYLEGISYFTDYFSTLELDPQGRTLRGNIDPETLKEFGPALFVDLIFNLSLLEALRFHGLYYLHAAAVVDEQGRGYLFSGNAGSGKTSLALSLVESGYKFISDDTVFLQLAGNKEVKVLGFMRSLHVPEELLSRFPRFAKPKAYSSYQIGGIRKVRFPVEVFSEEMTEGVTNPVAVLFPELVEAGTRLIPLSMNEAMARLLPQSMSVTFNPCLARDHLEALKRVVGHAQGFRLLAGPELKADPKAAAEVMEKVRARVRGG